MRGAIYVEESQNAKISGENGKVDATYTSIKQSCPATCSLRKSGCYAETSYTGMITKRLDRRARQSSPLQLARAEAKAISASYRGKAVPAGRHLRLHVSGDSRTIKGTRVLARAVARWKQRGGGCAWSYTHAWRHVSRQEWGSISVLASIEHASQVSAVREQGFAPALVVSEHVSDKAYRVEGSETLFIPCPSQTRNISCVKCRLCFNADRLFATNRGIAFAAHGAAKEKTKRHLTVVQA